MPSNNCKPFIDQFNQKHEYTLLNKSIKNEHSSKDPENCRTLSKFVSMNISIKIAFVDL